MTAGYDLDYYYTDPEMQLIINMDRIRHEIIAIVETQCKRCGRNCECLHVGVTSRLQTNANIELLQRLGVGVISSAKKQYTAKIQPRDGANMKVLQKDWSFEVSCLNIEVNRNFKSCVWKLKSKNEVTSETIEEFFQSIRSKAVKCS